MSKTYLFYHRVYESPKRAHYDHCCIALAEGMLELGVTFYGNVDYWQDYGSAEYLIAKQPAGYDADVHIFSDSFVQDNFHRIDQIINPNKTNILIDSSGFPWLNLLGKDISSKELLHIYEDPRFGLFDLILRSHYSTGFNYGPKVKPWAFGVTNRMLEEVKKSWEAKPQRVVISNFRNNLDIRKLATAKLDPILSKQFEINNATTERLDDMDSAIPFEDDEERYYWQLTGRRHRSAYYRSLNSSLLTYTFGGLIGIKDKYNGLNNPAFLVKNKVAKKVKDLLGMDFADNIVIYQFDSWRIWEAMLSNTCPINMDFEEWGMRMPVMPVNGKHYWGISRLQFNESAQKLMSLTDLEIRAIGAQGSDWAIRNYSPAPTAMRFMKLLGDTGHSNEYDGHPLHNKS